MSDAAVAELAEGRCAQGLHVVGVAKPATTAGTGKPATAAAGADPHTDRPQPRALSETERAAILAELHSERFVDNSPTEVWAIMLDEGRYLGSISTFYRLLRRPARAGSAAGRPPPATVKPELLATGPNQVW